MEAAEKMLAQTGTSLVAAATALRQWRKIETQQRQRRPVLSLPEEDCCLVDWQALPATEYPWRNGCATKEPLRRGCSLRSRGLHE